MDTSIEIALIQMGAGGIKGERLENAASLAREARATGARLIAFPELFNDVYFATEILEKNVERAEPIPGPTTELLSSLAAELDAVIVGSIFEKAIEGVYFNTAVVFERDGRLLGKVRKMHIPDSPGYVEKFYFTPGDTGYPVFETSLLNLAVPTCWDQWFPEVARIVALKGADLIVYPTCHGSLPGHDQRDVSESWQVVMRGHAIANSLFVAAVNRVGHEGEAQYFGRSFVADPSGRVVAEAGCDQQEVLHATLSAEALRDTRLFMHCLRDRRPETYGPLLTLTGQEGS
jgi:N-carbamoylputrescine amidase